MPYPGWGQLGDDLEGQGQLLAGHVEVDKDPAVARLGGRQVDLQQLKVCAGNVLHCSNTSLTSLLGWRCQSCRGHSTRAQQAAVAARSGLLLLVSMDRSSQVSRYIRGQCVHGLILVYLHSRKDRQTAGKATFQVKSLTLGLRYNCVRTPGIATWCRLVSTDLPFPCTPQYALLQLLSLETSPLPYSGHAGSTLATTGARLHHLLRRKG